MYYSLCVGGMGEQEVISYENTFTKKTPVKVYVSYYMWNM